MDYYSNFNFNFIHYFESVINLFNFHFQFYFFVMIFEYLLSNNLLHSMHFTYIFSVNIFLFIACKLKFF
jgi:hypothetical protein